MTQAAEIPVLPGQRTWDPVPVQAPVTEGYVDVGGARLWYRDTGGGGEPVVLLHPFTGSALTWGYQQPALVAAGYRVIAYSRRGHYRSDAGYAEQAGTGVQDLYRLVEHLGLERFHLVGLAAGADIVPDFALSYPERLLSIVVGGTIGKPGDPAYRETDAVLLPQAFRDLPAWLKELSPAYRAANPDGVAEWRALEAISSTERVPVPAENEITPEHLAAIDIPVLLFTGDADLYMPPSRLRAYAQYWNRPAVVIFAEAGHAVYWEQPEAFNRVLIEFLGRPRQALAAAQEPGGDAAGFRIVPAQTAWSAVPEQAPASEGFVDVGGVRLWYWDTGGDGEAVVLLHPYTGSAAIWGYQQPVLVDAGYRVIAYSRRGHHRSEAGPGDDPGTYVDDLEALASHLGLEKFHLVGSAAGGFIVPDYAASHSDRLLSMTIACSLGGVAEPAYRETFLRIRTPEIVALPHWVKELGPSYRAANPEGVAAWRALEEHAAHTMLRPPAKNELTWDVYERMQAPLLLIGADADMYVSPPMLRDLASHLPDPEVVLIRESGHSAYWEQPEAFNRTLLDFLRRHPASR